MPVHETRGFEDPLHARIAELIYHDAGIVLGPEKTNMIQARLIKRLAATGSSTLSDYVQRLDAGRLPGERDHLVSALTTNFTQFFREIDHFDFLRDVVFRDPSARIRQFRIWSAGCSSGQEPYSIGMTAQQCGIRAAIIATDVDQRILARAEQGRYPASEIAHLPLSAQRLGFAWSKDEWQVRPRLRDMVRFQRLNLHMDWPFDRRFDAIFCRNVIIYFDADAQQRLWARFCQHLKPGGWLFIGHSERIPDHMRDRLRPVRHTIYQYVPDEEPR